MFFSRLTDQLRPFPCPPNLIGTAVVFEVPRFSMPKCPYLSPPVLFSLTSRTTPAAAAAAALRCRCCGHVAYAANPPPKPILLLLKHVIAPIFPTKQIPKFMETGDWLVRCASARSVSLVGPREFRVWNLT